MTGAAGAAVAGAAPGALPALSARPWPGGRGVMALLAVLALAGLAMLARVLAQPVAPGVAAAVVYSQVLGCRTAAQTLALRQAALATLLAESQPGGDGCRWQPLALPSHQATGPLTHGVDRNALVVQWLQVRHAVPAQPGPASALTVYMPRLSGAAWVLRVDGQPIADNLADWRMTWNRPLVVSVPPALAVPGRTLRLELGLAHALDTGHSLQALQVGPAAALAPTVAWRQALELGLPAACSAVLLLLGLFFGGFWLARRSERAHGLLALASVAWCVCNLQYVLPRHDDPALEGWYASIVGVAIVWVMWLVYLVVLQFEPQRVPWLRRALPLYVLGVTMLAAPAWALQRDAGLLLQAVNSAVAAGVTAVIVRMAWRGSVELRAIAVALVLAAAAGAHDCALLAHRVPGTSLYLLPLASLGVFGAFGFAVQRRYQRAIDAHDLLGRELAARLAAREAELTASHERLRVLERDQALQAERQRLMGDIHDGLGSTLVSTLAALEQNRLSPGATAQALRHCVEDLRLVIESLDPMADGVAHLLATLRWRLGPRLEAAGLQLQWQLGDLDALATPDPSQALQLLRLVQEALTNVVKHAGASLLQVSAQRHHHRLVLTITDNGRGFDPHTVRAGRGLASMHSRARQLGGALRISRRPGGGTVWQLTLACAEQATALAEPANGPACAAHGQAAA